MPTRVLILDGNQRNALAATRALGRRGIPVVVADECGDSLAGSSKHCEATFVYPSPYTDPAGFIATVTRASVEMNVGVILPMTDLTTLLVLKNRQAFAPAIVPFASLEAFEALTDKTRLLDVARELGVPMPATHVMDGGAHLAALNGQLTYPIVLKPHRSRLWCEGQWTAATVTYADSANEADGIVRNQAYFRQCPFLAQEYIRGEGQGVFALYDRGKAVAFFAHRRLREKPPSGGVSVLSESIPVDARLRDFAQRILDHVKWHGVAMVEFKVAADGTPYLMEVNARFWGSLQLAIDAGVDFPYLLYRMATGETLEIAPPYGVGVRSRWLLGDLDHLYLTFKDGPGKGAGLSRWRTMLQFVKFFDRKTRYEVNRLEDWKPFFIELKQYWRAALNGSF